MYGLVDFHRATGEVHQIIDADYDAIEEDIEVSRISTEKMWELYYNKASCLQ